MRGVLLSFCVLVATALAACDGAVPKADTGVSPPDAGDVPKVAVTVGGNVTGLSGTGLVLRNGSDELPISANGPFTFATKLETGTTYDARVQTQPIGQFCTVLNGSGEVATADVTTIVVSCSSSVFSVGGTVNGLAGTLELQINGGETKSITSNGAFAFPTKRAFGSQYVVTVRTQPPDQTCAVANGTGTVSSAVTSIEVACAINHVTVGGTVSGLAGTGLKLTNNGGDALSIATNGAFVFETELMPGQGYVVAVSKQPSNVTQHCEVIGGSGTVTSGSVTDVMVVCTTSAFAVGGTVTGLVGTIVLEANGQERTLTNDGAFAFTTPIESGMVYSVTVKTQPVGQTCVVTNGSGTVTSSDVATVGVSCTSNTYAVGGVVNGLTSSTVQLELNGGETLSVSTNKVFRFATEVVYGGAYKVVVKTQPVGQTCVVTNGEGTMPAAAVEGIGVACSPNSYSVGGTVSGLAGSLQLQINNGETKTLASDGTFTFPTRLVVGSPYTVTVRTHPQMPSQTCTIANGTGTVGVADVTTIQVTCTTQRYTVGGSVYGLAGTGLKLTNNGGDELSIAGNGTFVFSSPITSGQGYSMAVSTQPSNLTQRCELFDGSGTVTSGPVTNVTVLCTTSTFALGGSVTGLSGTVVLRSNGQERTLTSDGGFAFATPILSGVAYAVTVKTQPVGQTCVVASGSGTITDSDVSTVRVSCSFNPYAVGATVYGLMSGFVRLELNGGETKDVSANQAFRFTTGVAPGATYSVVVKAQPVGQVCVVLNGQGTMPSAVVEDIAVTCSPKLYFVGGTVSGLAGAVELQINNGETKTLTSDGAFTFPTELVFGSAYSVRVRTQPPSQTCTIANGTGTVGGADVTTVMVSCSADRVTVGGTVSGLQGWGLKLKNNGGDEISVTGNGSFVFPTKLAPGQTYAVTVSSQPSSPTQQCNVIGGSGTTPNGPVTNVMVVCTTSAFFIGGSVSGLSGTVVLNSYGQELTLTGNGPFAFTTPITSGFTYNVKVTTQPAGQTCVVTDGFGPIWDSDVTTIAVSCTANAYTIGGVVSGLMSGTLMLALDVGAQTRSLLANGSYSFAAAIPNGASYTVSITAQPVGQTCVLTNASGAVTSAVVTNVNVTCAVNTYTVSGTVTGLLSSTTVTLQLNGGETRTVNADGVFSFTTKPAYGSNYAVVVPTQPTGQTCVVTNGSGVVPAADVSSVAVSCTTNTYTIGGSISGLSAGGRLVLAVAPTNQITIVGGTSFTFLTGLAYRSTYTLTVKTQPAGQVCTVTPSTQQTMPASNVTSFAVSCSCAAGYTWNGSKCEGLYVSVAAGGDHSCAVRADGALWCWGRNGSGQMGDGLAPGDALTGWSTPVQVGSAMNWSAVSAGQAYSCGTRADGTLWCWGDNGYGQIGDGTTTTRLSPVQVTSATNWSAVSAGYSLTCGVRTNGTLWCWGDNEYGQIGDGTTTGRSSPVQITSATNWRNVSPSSSHVCGTRTDGTLWCWGENYVGQVGDGTQESRMTPVRVGSATNWKSVATGSAFTCGTRTDGTLWCWGDNTDGQIGDGTRTTRTTPVQVGSATNWSVVETGTSHVCGMRTDGTLWCWGYNYRGRLGDSTTTTRTTPVQVGTATNWSSVSAGDQHTCGTRTDQTVWCWGNNSLGAPGTGVGSRKLAPVQIGTASNHVALALGSAHTCTRRADGTLWCAGLSNYGQLGDGTTSSRPALTQIGSVTTWSSLGAGTDHSCGTQANGTLWCWGTGYAGTLGDGTWTNRSSPVQVGAASNWSAVTGGGLHTCGLGTNGWLWCWGTNSSGQLGNGNTTDQPAPVQVGAASNWSSVDAGTSHTCGTRTDGTLWCWGRNEYGRLGDGTTTNRSSPARVGSATNWNAVAAGAHYTCGTRTDGTLWCWGRNDGGQLGDGTTTDRWSPVQVGTATNWSSITAGDRFTCGTRTDGTLWCWGRNDAGQLGDGTTTLRVTPVQTGTATNWNAVAAGDLHACGTRMDGTLWCWGWNDDGQVGDGTAFYTTPMQAFSL